MKSYGILTFKTGHIIQAHGPLITPGGQLVTNELQFVFGRADGGSRGVAI